MQCEKCQDRGTINKWNPQVRQYINYPCECLCEWERAILFGTGTSRPLGVTNAQGKPVSPWKPGEVCDGAR